MIKIFVVIGLNKIIRFSKNVSNVIYMIWLLIIGKINFRWLFLKKIIMVFIIN